MIFLSSIVTDYQDLSTTCQAATPATSAPMKNKRTKPMRTFDMLHPLAPDAHLGGFSEFEEHGSRWLECVACGAQWSIVATNRGDDLEQVSDGDGYCEDHNALVGDACKATEAFTEDELEKERK